MQDDIEKAVSPHCIESGVARSETMHMPALNCMHDDQSNNVLWVPTLRWRTGGCWRGAGPWPAACLAAPASNALLVINVEIAAEPGDSQGIGMLHTIPYTVAYKGHCGQKLGSGQT